MLKTEKVFKKMFLDLVNGNVRDYKRFMRKYKQIKRETLHDKRKKGGENKCYN